MTLADLAGTDLATFFDDALALATVKN